MRLSAQPPRRFSTRSSPGYPALVAAGALLAATACKPASNGAGEAPIAPDPVATAAKAKASSTTTAEAPKPGAPAHFAVDDDPLELHDVTCKGDCPSPFESAASRKDAAQVQARADWCVRDAERRAPGDPVVAAEAWLRATVDKSGKPAELSFEPNGALPPAIAACVTGLVGDAKLTPPENSGVARAVYARVLTTK
jgi:hypothetical protein